MDNRLNSNTQIWADGYSFREVSETLLMALGIRSDDPDAGKSELGRVEPAASTAQDLTDAEVDR
ncbi:hypothetical protein CH92_21515 [Stutzerimonas stutzeri]|uniref:Uncharacterized protein n=1 Tax=Stutzerimonas stutzeri TaxID=316 RepID=W8RGN9_STUST|nr:hypothetical protein CH92_21515 [Stutzerimonas stutzeri]